MIKIGIVGDIGSGKSYVARKFKFPIFNADLEVTKIYIDNNNNESKGFHVDDGAGVALARLADIPIAFLSGRYSESTTIRARELKIKYCYQGKLDKITGFNEIIDKYNVKPNENNINNC